MLTNTRNLVVHGFVRRIEKILTQRSLIPKTLYNLCFAYYDFIQILCGGADWSIQLEIKPLKTKNAIKKPGPWRPKKIVNGKIVDNPRYYYEQVWTYKLTGIYSRGFLKRYGDGAKNRKWGQINCKEDEYQEFMRVMEEMIVKDVEQMIINNDGNIIRRNRYCIEGWKNAEWGDDWLAGEDWRRRLNDSGMVDKFVMRAHMGCNYCYNLNI